MILQVSDQIYILTRSQTLTSYPPHTVFITPVRVCTATLTARHHLCLARNRQVRSHGVLHARPSKVETHVSFMFRGDFTPLFGLCKTLMFHGFGVQFGVVIHEVCGAPIICQKIPWGLPGVKKKTPYLQRPHKSTYNDRRGVHLVDSFHSQYVSRAAEKTLNFAHLWEKFKK